MNGSNFLPTLALGLSLALTVTGCHKRLNTITTIPPNSQSINTEAQPSGPTGLPAGPAEGVAGKNLGEGGNMQNEREIIRDMLADRDTFKSQTAYFDFDRSNIKPSEAPKLQAVADYLKNNPTDKVQIEGNCDERGTEEYNRALGERRAIAARDFLVNLGVAADRLFTISYGEDKPAVQGHDETAWAKNRRDDFVLLKPKGAAPSP